MAYMLFAENKDFMSSSLIPNNLQEHSQNARGYAAVAAGRFVSSFIIDGRGKMAGQVFSPLTVL